MPTKKGGLNTGIRLKNFSTTVVLLLLAIITHAQDATLKGRILNNTKQPVQDATITLKGTNTGTYTNAAGYFRLEHIKPGKYILVVKMLGYTPSEKGIILKTAEEMSIELSLTEESVTKEGITVSTKTHSRKLKESGFAVNAIDTKAFANTTADMNSILNKTTGVRVREQGGMGSDFNFSINGLSGKAIRFSIDGVPMEVMGSSMTLNNIPVNLAERIEVYKGVLPVYLGADALGGAVNLVTDQQVKNYLDASYSIGSFNTHRAAVTAQSTSKKLGIITRLRGFYNYSDNNYIMRNIEIWDAGKQEYVKKDIRRFHDRFSSAMAQAEVGVMNKKWAGVFFIGAGYSATDKQIQTGTNQETVYGAAKQKGDAFSATLRYKKKDLFTKGMEMNIFASNDNTDAGFIYAYAVIDLSAGTVVKKLRDIPLDKGETLETVMVESGKAYIMANSQNGKDYIWVYDVANGTLKAGLEIIGGYDYMLRIDNLK